MAWLESAYMCYCDGANFMCPIMLLPSLSLILIFLEWEVFASPYLLVQIQWPESPDSPLCTCTPILQDWWEDRLQCWDVMSRVILRRSLCTYSPWYNGTCSYLIGKPVSADITHIWDCLLATYNHYPIFNILYLTLNYSNYHYLYHYFVLVLYLYNDSTYGLVILRLQLFPFLNCLKQLIFIYRSPCKQ